MAENGVKPLTSIQEVWLNLERVLEADDTLVVVRQHLQETENGLF